MIQESIIAMFAILMFAIYYLSNEFSHLFLDECTKLSVIVVMNSIILLLIVHQWLN